MNFIEKVGNSIINRFKTLFYEIGYFGRVVSSGLFFISRGKVSRKILVMQLLFTFVEALPICSVLSLGIGTAIVFIGKQFLMGIGQFQLTYTLLVLVIVRELGPLLIAFIVTARSATAIATEISTNVINHEIEAYISVGINPFDHLVAPRFLGVTLSMFFLNIYFSLFGLLVPSIVIQFISTTSFMDYFNLLFQALSVKAIVISIIKSIIFGMIISTSAT
ncbi:MAG: ABC transporter permease [Treponemataceae bacterium]|nr:ABC transporter permease [Treponemataceae bacterium]